MNRWKPKTPEQLAHVQRSHDRWNEIYNATLEAAETSDVLSDDSIFKKSNDRHRLEPGEAISIALAKREEF